MKKLEKDREELLACFDFSTRTLLDWTSIITTNPIELAFATVWS
ncbi:MAG: hypothetical protein ACTS73_08305 [Arsenophonus sp. NEOnobi-MAG3]